MQNKQNVSIVGLGHIGLPMMTILSNLRKNGKYLYNVNVIEKNNRLGKDKQKNYTMNNKQNILIIIKYEYEYVYRPLLFNIILQPIQSF